MFSRFAHKSLFSLTAVILCAVVTLGSVSTAQASCGDYLAHPHSGQAMGGEHDAHVPLAPAMPCRGPHCSRAPEKQPLPAPHRVVLLPDRDALCISVLDGAAPQHAAWVAFGDDDLLDSFLGRRLFRPPRMVV